MIEAAKVIRLIQQTPGYNDKMYLLKKNESVPHLKEILRFIYNPYLKTGISSAKIYKALSMVPSDTTFISLTDIIDYLTKYNTGSDAASTMAARFINCTKVTYAEYPFTAEVAEAVVTQNLQIGVTAKTLNTVYGANFIPTVGCILGTKVDSSTMVEWPCIVTEKLDGARRILIKENGVSRLFSRSGHEDVGLVDILAEAKHLPDNRVYDGELLAIGEFKDSIALRQATNSLASGGGTKHGLTFNMFDMVPVDEFYAGISDDDALKRKFLLGATLMDSSIEHLQIEDWPKYIMSYGVHTKLDFIKPVPILGVARNMSDVEPLVAPIWKSGGEGVMLNTVAGRYEIKRSKKLLKVKRTKSYTLKVIDLIEGMGKFEDKLGALVVDFKGNKVGVGTGFSDFERTLIWQFPSQYIGKTVEVDSFGVSTNQNGGVSLNCPVFKRFVEDK